MSKSNGYGQLGFSIGGKHFHFESHKIAWISFKREFPPNGLNVLHNCIANPACCNPNHLRLGTQFDNVQDMFNQKRNPKRTGENNGQSKLTVEQVTEIRAKYSAGNTSYRKLAREFGMSSGHICHIVTMRNWKHV